MELKTISVMGCGWLGLPLAEELVKRGYRVKGSTTTAEKLPLLAAKGIEPFLVQFPENSSKSQLREFLEADVLLFNIPPSRSTTDQSTYEQLLQAVLERCSPQGRAVLFVSSTSVYPDLNRGVTEADAVPSPNASSLMLRCEFLVQQAMPGRATVVRFGGLMGGQRHPGRFLAGKTAVPQPDGPVNMIHLTDCVQLLAEMIRQEKWGYVFNACAPEHPTRQAFYTQASQLLGLVPPKFTQSSEPKFKRISSERVQQELSYTFLYPNPLTCLTSPAF
ncbi:SDR family oxidoreductase [Rufibacter psychrotolerans]|uniref:SDR family oxidoreductase n=1 Tax=Rufibacter psychrotolerans TaxID=2812556 RepID=UPI001968503F|nr:SDR family oxidoreductase [Rufibacter sp. SYSU D00308]